MGNGDDGDGTLKFSMTITETTEAWLTETYPDAATVQEAIRMAIADARLVREGDGEKP